MGNIYFNVNCIHIDKNYKCQNTEKVKNSFFIFRPLCPVAYANGCDHKEEHPKPDAPPSPPTITPQKKVGSVIITVDTP